MSPKPKVIWVCDECGQGGSVPEQLRDSYDVLRVSSCDLAQLPADTYQGVFLTSGHLGDALRLARAIQDAQVLEGMPDGVVLLESDNRISWANDRFLNWVERDDVVGQGFYAVLGNPEILGPDFCPFHTALATGQPSSSTIRVNESRYFQTHAAPLCGPDGLTAAWRRPGRGILDRCV